MERRNADPLTMTAYTASLRTAPSRSSATQHGAADVPRCFALIGTNPTPRYFLACFDSGRTRHYWASYVLDTTAAPTLGGALTYDTSTLTIIGRL